MQNIEYVLAENLGDSELFTGRKVLMDNFLHWVYLIGKRLGKSRALLSRRKKGKTVFMQRLYNIIWTQNKNVVPFFYEVKERKMTLGEFAEEFLYSFLSQYYAFIKREKKYIIRLLKLEELFELIDDTFTTDYIKTFLSYKKDENFAAMWEFSRKAPHTFAAIKDIQILQFIDEFQNINKYIVDKNNNEIDTLAGSYLGTAESKLAPMFISGSYIGWLRRIIWKQLPARFNEAELENLEPAEALDMIIKYSKFYEIPVSLETAEYIQGLTQGDPFYISILFESLYLGKKDYTDYENINDVYEYEITKGNIKKTWLEYLYKAFSEVNDAYAKRIVLYLFNANGEERTREKILDDLQLEMSDRELEEKLKSLVASDIISQGESNFRYKISNDRIYEMVFRNIYQEEIDNVGKEIRKTLRSQIVKQSFDLGHYYEYRFEKILNEGFRLNEVTYNGGERFIRAEGEIYRNYYLKETRLKNMEIDLYGKTEDGEEILIELKRWNRKTGVKNIEKFIRLKNKYDDENKPSVYIFFAMEGFTKDAEKKLGDNGIFFGDTVKYPVI